MQLHYVWWILALALGVLELVSGTFYLLVFALACAAAGFAAWAGAGFTVQVLVTAAIALAGWAALRAHARSRAAASPRGDSDMLLDVGEVLGVDQWDEDRRARVRYRGAEWTVELDQRQPASAAIAGRFVIERVVGNRLVVRRVDPAE